MALTNRAKKLLFTTTVNQLLMLILIPNLTSFDSIKQIYGENYEVVCDSNKRNQSNDNNSSEQNNDGDIDFAITQMKELIQNVKKLHATYQFVFDIFDPLPSKDTENKCYVLLELSNNKVPAWKKKRHSHRRQHHVLISP